MNSQTLTTATGVFLALEPTLSEFDHWNRAALAKRKAMHAWIVETLDSASRDTAPKFTNEDLPEADPREGRDRLVFRFDAFPANALQRQLRAAILAEYPTALCYRLTGRRKPTRYSASRIFAAWAHGTLNRAAKTDRPILPANVIPFPTPRGGTK
jgi:hypothetical protein